MERTRVYASCSNKMISLSRLALCRDSVPAASRVPCGWARPLFQPSPDGKMLAPRWTPRRLTSSGVLAIRAFVNTCTNVAARSSCVIVGIIPNSLITLSSGAGFYFCLIFFLGTLLINILLQITSSAQIMNPFVMLSFWSFIMLLSPFKVTQRKIYDWRVGLLIISMVPLILFTLIPVITSQGINVFEDGTPFIIPFLVLIVILLPAAYSLLVYWIRRQIKTLKKEKWKAFSSYF